MKENKISTIINKSVSEVFSYTVDPSNTPKWIDSIEKEETNEWPVKVGSIYRNVDASGKWNEYICTALEENKLFELTLRGGGFYVRYTYASINETTSNLEYFEWVDEGELESPFPQEALNKLKELLEND